MQKFLLGSLLFVAISCGKSLPSFEGVNLNQWKEDKFGCSGKRIVDWETLKEQTDKLKGLSEAEIIEVMGRPDHNELYKRNQKFYHYFVEGARECARADTTNQKLLSIRFNAMGYAKEVDWVTSR